MTTRPDEQARTFEISGKMGLWMGFEAQSGDGPTQDRDRALAVKFASAIDQVAESHTAIKATIWLLAV